MGEGCIRTLLSEDLKLETLVSREKITHSAHYSVFVVPPGLRRNHILASNHFNA